MNQPTISVIIPVFNGKRTLHAALQSVWEQSFPAHEIIVIDGGSTDGTRELLESLKLRIHHLISERDAGVFDAINKGIALATGEWIYVLGSDDVLAAPDTFETISSHLAASQSLVFGSIHNLNIKQSLVPEVHISSMTSMLYVRNTLHQQSVFYHRSLFIETNFDPSLKVLADYDFHLHLFSKGQTGKYVDVVVAHCDASGLSKQFNSSLYREEYRLKKKQLGIVAAMLLVPVLILKYLLKKRH